MWAHVAGVELVWAGGKGGLLWVGLRARVFGALCVRACCAGCRPVLGLGEFTWSVRAAVKVVCAAAMRWNGCGEAVESVPVPRNLRVSVRSARNAGSVRRRAPVAIAHYPKKSFSIGSYT